MAIRARQMLRSYFGRTQNANISRKHATALNKVIDTFNQPPNVNLQPPRVRIEEELRRFEDACAQGRGLPALLHFTDRSRVRAG